MHFSAQNRLPDEGGFWSITGHELVSRINRDWPTFSSARRGVVACDDMGVPLDVQRLQMLSMDPPRHDRLRAIVAKAFTPKRIASHENTLRNIIAGVLDRFIDAERCDLVKDIAKPIPARVIGSLLGTPESDDWRLLHWTNVVAAFEDPEIRTEWDDPQHELSDIIQYVDTAKQQRVTCPRNDLLTALLDAEVDGDRLDDLELAAFFVQLLAAGNDSTRATYAATMKAQIEHPQQRQAVADDTSLIANVVEEGLRCFPAFSFMGRAATHDIELEGQLIHENDRVLLWYIASNRDPAVFEHPEVFDIHRPDVDAHQAFGAGGRHFCLGASLARLELQLWIEETLKRFPAVKLDGPSRRVQSIFLNQYKSIPVRLKP